MKNRAAKNQEDAHKRAHKRGGSLSPHVLDSPTIQYHFFFFYFTQGAGGSFTHFYPGTHHAVDLECPEGTPVLAMASGVVKEVRQSNTAGGVHARGLFDWNSVGT